MLPHMMKRITTRTVLFLAASAVCCALPAAGGCRQETGKPEQTGRSPEHAQEEGKPYYHGLIEEYRSLLAEDPHNLAAIIALGNAMYDAGQWRDAVHQYEQALQIDPHSADVMTDMGTCYRNLGMPDLAIQTYERTLAIEPNHQNALYNLGIVYGRDKKEYRKAIAYWEKLLHIVPKHPHADDIRMSIHAFKQALRKKTP